LDIARSSFSRLISSSIWGCQVGSPNYFNSVKIACMPSGKIHALATCLAVGVIAPSLFTIAGTSTPSVIAFSLGALTGILVNPDLDMPAGSRSFSLVRHTGGSFIGWLWSRFWLPYAHLIPHHRHFLSHSPLLSTALRLLYLFGIPMLIYTVVRAAWIVHLSASPFPLPPPLPPISALTANAYFWWWVGGLAVADTLHCLIDWSWK
jgi:uncharacterized metal-binding protein